MWGIIKTFIVASGVTTTIVILGSALSWKLFEIDKIMIFIIITLIYAGTAFFSLLAFRESNKFIDYLNQRFTWNRLRSLHKFLTRNLSEVDKI